MEDHQIVDLYWQRSSDAIAESSAKYGGYCHTIAYRILGNRQDAEECVNDTWAGAWNAMPVHRPTYLGAFLGTITRRIACNRLCAQRAEKRGGGELTLVLEELTDCIPHAPSAAQAVEDTELEQAVSRFLHTLSRRDCSLFLRRYWFAEPVADIAARYGLRVGTVKTSLCRSREKLRRYLEKEELL
ncbi:RNA polymerase sigma factor [Dysosmobacter sp.]|uniref:RNA polymerase sigma factor n=1 Tax=Dysosmobacter sp. TaxID=2591382 RepID=UPI002A942FCC|nr:sigma-70 family RNA polymerase sigma factor [Dysosmobacter sp.]MDY5612941.1 sigma-70 family RNA polymerase sigma factor [Dysosmobacter sp.]